MLKNEAIENQSIDLDRLTKGLMRDIIQGLKHVHTSLLSENERAFHADVHPGNILVKEQSDGSVVAKISDFGLSKVLGAMQSSTIMTSRRPNGEGWVAPEVLRGERLGSKADGQPKMPPCCSILHFSRFSSHS